MSAAGREDVLWDLLQENDEPQLRPLHSECVDQNRWTVHLDVTVPANTTAEVWLPAGSEPVTVPGRATFVRTDGGHAVYSVQSGRFVFTA